MTDQPRRPAGSQTGGPFAEHQPTSLDLGTSWPAVQHREATWTAIDRSASRRQQTANRGMFSYAVTPAIRNSTPDIDAELAADADDALTAVEDFDRVSEGWGTPFASVLLRSESASSSQIENLTSSARKVALASLGDSSSRNASLVARNVAALRAAIDLADNISPNAIRAMHERLDGGDDPENSGKFRTQPVWIGGASPVTASFVAIHHDQIEEAIDDLVAFMKRDDLQPLVQAALAHAQFETIHPFTDGNGRTGRALVSSILRRRGSARHMSVPISSGLLADTSEYFSALTSYRQGDVAPIVEQFSAASRRSVANASVLREDVANVRDQVLATASRRTANLVILADLCASEPAFNAEMLVQRSVPTASAYRILDRLQEAGVVRCEGPIRGSMVWTVPALTDALDRFAERAGRRTFNQP